jgi:ABC-2 type transport system permease protein
MAVFKRGYQRYAGPRTSNLTRFLAVPRFVWPKLLAERFVIILLVNSLFWPMLCAGFIYVSNHAELLPSLGSGGDDGIRKMLTIDGKFFAIFMNVQSTFAIILAAIAGPGLIAPDLANNALPLYFARPLSRWSYIGARMMVLFGLLSLVTLLPGLIVFGMQASLASSAWLAANWSLGQGMVLGFLLYIFMVSLIALTCSAYVKWRVVAGALVLGFFFVLAGAAQIINQVFRVEWGSLLNPGYAIYTVWCSLLGVENAEDAPGAWECFTVLLVMLGALLAVLLRKLRPVEVVS